MIIPDEIIHSRRKTLSISIDGQGRVIVRAPLRCAEEEILSILAEKEGWILSKKREAENTGVKLPGENLENYRMMLLGEEHTLRLLPITKVGYDVETRTLYIPEKNGREYLIRWLKKNAARILSQVTEQTAKRMGTTFHSVQITSARGRWGSCSQNNALHYSFRLLYAPKEVIEYVVVHELAHTLQKNHSKSFWEIVGKYVPDWKEKRGWLKTYAGLMDVF